MKRISDDALSPYPWSRLSACLFRFSGRLDLRIRVCKALQTASRVSLLYNGEMTANTFRITPSTLHPDQAIYRSSCNLQSSETPSKEAWSMQAWSMKQFEPCWTCKYSAQYRPQVEIVASRLLVAVFDNLGQVIVYSVCTVRLSAGNAACQEQSSSSSILILLWLSLDPSITTRHNFLLVWFSILDLLFPGRSVIIKASYSAKCTLSAVDVMLHVGQNCE